MSQEKPAGNQAHHESEAQVESEYVYRGKRITVRVDHIEQASGRKYIREIVEHPGAVVMVPVSPDGRVILVRQWRRASGKILLELPAGTLEPGEEPAVTAGRELQEEIGYRAGRLTPLGGFFSAPGFCTEYLHLFVAEDLEESRLDPDENEEIETVTASLDQAMKWIEQGMIEDAKSIAGLSRYYIAKQQH